MENNKKMNPLLLADIEFQGKKVHMANGKSPLEQIAEKLNYRGKLLVIADPSMGKSMSVKMLCLHCLKIGKKFILIEAKELNSMKNNDVDKLITDLTQMPEGTAVILDDYDRISEDKKKRAAKILEKMGARETENDRLIVVTSRFAPDGSKEEEEGGDSIFRDFIKCEFSPLSEEQIEKALEAKGIPFDRFEKEKPYFKLLETPMYLSMLLHKPELRKSGIVTEAGFIDAYFNEIGKISTDVCESLYYYYVKNETSDSVAHLIGDQFKCIFTEEGNEDDGYYLESFSTKYVNYGIAKYILRKLKRSRTLDIIPTEAMQELYQESLSMVGQLLREEEAAQNKKNTTVWETLNEESLKCDTDQYYNILQIFLGYTDNEITDKASNGVFDVGNVFAKLALTRFKYKYPYDDFSELAAIAIKKLANRFAEYAKNSMPKKFVDLALKTNSSKFVIKTVENGVVYLGNRENPYVGVLKVNKNLETIELNDRCVAIGVDSFTDGTNIKRIVIPGNVTNIADGTFRGCDCLLEIKVSSGNNRFCDVDGVLFNKDKTRLLCYPAGRTDCGYEILDGVSEIGARAFWRCIYFDHVSIPNSVTKIEDRAFYGCKSLKSIFIPKSVTKIGDGAFRMCNELGSIRFEEGSKLNILGDNVFGNNDKLRIIFIADELTDIGESAFFCYRSLTQINVSANNANYCSEEGVLYSKDKTKLISYPAGKTATAYTVLNGVTSIGSNAFRNCRAIESITLPDSVIKIGKRAFEGCYELRTINIDEKSPLTEEYLRNKCNLPKACAVIRK